MKFEEKTLKRQTVFDGHILKLLWMMLNFPTIWGNPSEN